MGTANLQRPSEIKILIVSYTPKRHEITSFPSKGLPSTCIKTTATIHKNLSHSIVFDFTESDFIDKSAKICCKNKIILHNSPVGIGKITVIYWEKYVCKQISSYY